EGALDRIELRCPESTLRCAGMVLRCAGMVLRRAGTVLRRISIFHLGRSIHRSSTKAEIGEGGLHGLEESIRHEGIPLGVRVQVIRKQRCPLDMAGALRAKAIL